jgi:purine-binding chemotaxis protein CheW
MAYQQYVVFGLGSEKYGVPVDQIESIERLLPITRVPRTLPFIKGVVNLRGVVVPVIDVRERFHFPTVDATMETRILVVKVDGVTAGLIVSSVHDVVTIDVESIEPPPAMVGGIQAEYLNGIARVGDELLVLVNLNRILSDAESRQLQEVEKSVRGE